MQQNKALQDRGAQYQNLLSQLGDSRRDMVDRSNDYAFNYIKNRVDAFLEIRH